MAMLMEVEDDVFFADLNRQISLLITEDDDSYNHPILPHSSHPPVVVSIDQAFSRTPIFQSTTQPHYKFDQISNKTCTTDHSCKGTGVFIPKSSQWSRSRSRRSTNKQHLKPKPPIPADSNYTSHTPTINDIRNKLQNIYNHQQLPSQADFSQVMKAPRNASSWLCVCHHSPLLY